VLAATAASASAYKAFVTPTRNIGCVLEERSVRCDIRHHSWPTPRRPKSCELDYGSGVVVGRSGRAQFVCAGDTVLEAGPVLRYGESIRKGRFRCASSELGVRCVNQRDGHGFLLSKQKVHLF
ncbi:MAG: hypothetical protein JST31_14725, partial [Actinobacteria bacterium]|nr:hypothetical protein [Actinomycetota bacterium]